MEKNISCKAAVDNVQASHLANVRQCENPRLHTTVTIQHEPVHGDTLPAKVTLLDVIGCVSEQDFVVCLVFHAILATVKCSPNKTSGSRETQWWVGVDLWYPEISQESKRNMERPSCCTSHSGWY